MMNSKMLDIGIITSMYILLIAVAIFIKSDFALIAALLLALLTFFYSKYEKLIHSLILGRYNIVMRKERQYLAVPTCTVKLEASKYVGKAAAHIDPSRIKHTNENLLENIMFRINFPFSIKIDLSKNDTSKLIEKFETSLHMKEIQIANSADIHRINILRKQAAVIEEEIRQLANSEALMCTILLTTQFVSESEAECISGTSKQINELCNAFALAYNSEYSILQGEDLLAEV